MTLSELEWQAMDVLFRDEDVPDQEEIDPAVFEELEGNYEEV